MSTCSKESLMADAAGFAGSSPFTLQVLIASLLASILKELNHMADVSVATLLDSGKCFAVLSPHQLQVVIAQLLCEIKTQGIGVAGQTQVYKGIGAPVADPGVTTALYINTSDTAEFVLYYWDGAAWQPFG